MKYIKTATGHGAIILSLFYLVLYVIDRINNAMAFIAHNITLTMLLVLAFLSIVNALFVLNGAKKLPVFKKGCSYAAMIFALVYAVLFIIVKADDNAMSQIIDRDLTKSVMLVMAALASAVAVFMLSRERKLLRKRLLREKKRKRAKTQAHA